MWSGVKQDSYQAIAYSYQNNRLPKKWTQTSIVLIPKTTNLATTKDYRLISLWNTLYSLITRILMDQWRPILGNTIHEAQASFLSSKDLQEIFHSICTSDQRNSNCFLAKIDREKAYDRLQRDFLEDMLLKNGYSSKWTRWIMAFVTEVSYIITTNGHILSPCKQKKDFNKVILISILFHFMC